MTPLTRAVTVKQLPAAFTLQKKQLFLRELENCCLEAARPCIVLDCAETRALDHTVLHLLLNCLEEAMKRNGDVRLAAVSPEAQAILATWGVDRLFKIFATTAEAVASFQRPSIYAALSKMSHTEPTEDAA